MECIFRLALYQALVDIQCWKHARAIELCSKNNTSFDVCEVRFSGLEHFVK